MQNGQVRKGLKFILRLAIVQILVTWMPIQARAAELNIADQVADAKYVLAMAAQNNEKYAPYFKRALAALQKTKVFAGTNGTDFIRCKENLRLNAFFYNRVIYLCDRVIKAGPDTIVQTLIHESTHAAGYVRECDATRLSIYAMMIARRPNTEVGYQCVL
jgi:hypothetical protein